MGSECLVFKMRNEIRTPHIYEGCGMDFFLSGFGPVAHYLHYESDSGEHNSSTAAQAKPFSQICCCFLLRADLDQLFFWFKGRLLQIF
jgi:hypothetical protein